MRILIGYVLLLAAAVGLSTFVFSGTRPLGLALDGSGNLIVKVQLLRPLTAPAPVGAAAGAVAKKAPALAVPVALSPGLASEPPIARHSESDRACCCAARRSSPRVPIHTEVSKVLNLGQTAIRTNGSARRCGERRSSLREQRARRLSQQAGQP